MKTEVRAYRPVYPSPAALISSVDPSGRANVLTLGEVFNISILKPVIVGIAIRPATLSHGLISETRQYVVNLPSRAVLRQVDACGMVSGRDCPDKLAEFGLTALPSLKVRPPCIDECPVNLECEVIERLTVGDHDLFLGEVVAARIDSDKLDEKGGIRNELLDPLVYITGEYWSIGEKLADFGFTARERSRGA
jgi:flavin reductase (DIM6/NTAB) family NADH-FMN oxidoreductase RutF